MPLMGRDQWFSNPVTGMKMRMTVLPHDTGGRQFVAEYSYQAGMGKTAFPPHLHPHTTETFAILSGNARCLIDGEERPVKAGESVVLPANVAHIHPWSDGNTPILVRQTAECDPPDEPGLIAALQAAITIFGLANAGKVQPNGRPRLLQLALLAHETIPQTYLAGVPKSVQTVGTGAVSLVSRLSGVRFSYREYGVVTDAGIELPEDFKFAV